MNFPEQTKKGRGLHMKYFLLNPTKNNAFGEASRIAILAYAESIKTTDDLLAIELCSWVGELDRERAGKGGGE